MDLGLKSKRYQKKEVKIEKEKKARESSRKVAISFIV
jgi:hypothetical protein